MAIFELPFKIKLTNRYSNLDEYYGPYQSLSEARLSVPLVLREKGKTVAVIENGSAVEYWWKDGITDNDLVQKISSSSGASSLGDLNDVNVSDIQDGEVLKYNSQSGKWVNDESNALEHLFDGDSDGSLVGNLSSVSGLGAVALGFSTVNGDYSFACGKTNNISGQYSFACGYNNNILGPYSFTEGNGNKIENAYASHVEGTQNTLKSRCWVSHVAGDNNSVNGEYSYVFGQGNSVAGGRNVIFSQNSIVEGQTNIVLSANNNGQIGGGGHYRALLWKNRKASSSDTDKGYILSAPTSNFSLGGLSDIEFAGDFIQKIDVEGVLETVRFNNCSFENVYLSDGTNMFRLKGAYDRNGETSYLYVEDDNDVIRDMGSGVSDYINVFVVITQIKANNVINIGKYNNIFTDCIAIGNHITVDENIEEGGVQVENPLKGAIIIGQFNSQTKLPELSAGEKIIVLFCAGARSAGESALHNFLCITTGGLYVSSNNQGSSWTKLGQ